MPRFSVAMSLFPLFLAGCTVETVEIVEERPVASPRSGSCPGVLDPVCGERGGDRQTFANACEARRTGYDIIANGECRPRRPVFYDPEPDFCTQQYDPVCAVRNGRERTFSNACMARVEGWRVVDEGPC